MSGFLHNLNRLAALIAQEQTCPKTGHTTKVWTRKWKRLMSQIQSQQVKEKKQIELLKEHHHD